MRMGIVGMGASEPMAVSITPFERQLSDVGEACRAGRLPMCSGWMDFVLCDSSRVFVHRAPREKVRIEPARFQ
jgi:hypothetical protein